MMKFLIKILVFISFVSSYSTAHSFEGIKGAFGVMLGQKHESTGDYINSFKPADSKGYKAFNKYSVKITPKTHRVYSIDASGSKYDQHSCKYEQTQLLNHLTEKYGPEKLLPSLPEQYNTVARNFVIKQAGKYILISCLLDKDKVSLQISYVDEELDSLAKKELSSPGEKNIIENKNKKTSETLGL